MEAQRGGIYEFYDPYGERVPGRYALVIAAEDRSLDYFVSILLLTDCAGYGVDVVPVRVRGVRYFAHCGLVSYCQRGQLGKLVGRCEAVSLKRIEGKIPAELGLEPVKRPDYEKLYYDTLALLTKDKEIRNENMDKNKDGGEA